MARPTGLPFLGRCTFPRRSTTVTWASRSATTATPRRFTRTPPTYDGQHRLDDLRPDQSAQTPRFSVPSRRPILLAFTPGFGGGAAQIGPTLFLFGGVGDASGRNVMLLVDNASPANPVLTPFPVTSSASRIAAVGENCTSLPRPDTRSTRSPASRRVRALLREAADCRSPGRWIRRRPAPLPPLAGVPNSRA
jgi:hypothetical protein